MHFSGQDLNNEPKRYLLHGRCWWDFGKFLSLEWAIPARSGIAAELHLNHYGDTAIGVRISAVLFTLHVGTDNSRLYKFLEAITKRPDQKYTNGRIIGFYYSDGAFWFSLWDDPMESRSSDPKWWHFTVNLQDIIFGKVKHSKEVIEIGEAEIDMPEGSYPATFAVEKRTWKRARWFPKISTDVWFEIPAGIPHEGKGENSWDCGMDATSGIGTYWNQNIYDAAKRVALKCLAERSRYGNLSSPEYVKWREEHIGAVK